MVVFNDKYEHKIPFAMDYPFASDFYTKNDCRYPLIDFYKSKIKDKIGTPPYNCKISVPCVSNGFYNVHLYFKDIREVFTREEYHKFQVGTVTHHKENYFTSLFNDALEHYPIKQLRSLKLNPNGVFVADFRRRSLAYTADRAGDELKKLWASKYPQIASTTRWESSLYLFFHTIEALNKFTENDSNKFKEISHNILRKYDNDGFYNTETPSFTLDLLVNYDSIGGRNYFNSDAMNGLKVI